MFHDWKTPLWGQLRRAAQAHDIDARFPLYFNKKPAQRTEVVLVGTDLRVHLGDDVARPMPRSPRNSRIR